MVISFVVVKKPGNCEELIPKIRVLVDVLSHHQMFLIVDFSFIRQCRQVLLPVVIAATTEVVATTSGVAFLLLGS